MKAVSVPLEGLTLDRLLEEAAGGNPVFLTSQGRIRFALMPADEGDDEACAMRSNGELMAYLDEVAQRAQGRPRKTLQQIREKDNPPPSAPSA